MQHHDLIAAYMSENAKDAGFGSAISQFLDSYARLESAAGALLGVSGRLNAAAARALARAQREEEKRRSALVAYPVTEPGAVLAKIQALMWPIGEGEGYPDIQIEEVARLLKSAKPLNI